MEPVTAQVMMTFRDVAMPALLENESFLVLFFIKEQKESASF
jgi:hypothetical protein